MPAFSPVTAVVMDGKRPEKPLHAKSLGFSDAIWESVQLCWSDSISRPTAAQLFDDLSAAARLAWVPPSVYPIELKTYDAGVDSSGSSGVFLMNLIRDP